MRITKLDVFALRAPPQERPHWTSHFIVPTANEILVRLHTDEGLQGIGLATSYTPIDFAIKAFKSGLGEMVIGEDPLAPERLYRKLFGLTSHRLASEKGWSREALIRISAAVDIAAWDIIGKAANLPLYRLFGGYRSEITEEQLRGAPAFDKGDDENRVAGTWPGREHEQVLHDFWRTPPYWRDHLKR